MSFRNCFLFAVRKYVRLCDAVEKYNKRERKQDWYKNTIDNKELADDSGRIVEQVFFYGDKDGKAYFPGFMNSFSSKEWSISVKPEWAEIRSLRNSKIRIYANC